MQHIYETRFYSFHIYVLPITRDFLINFQKGRNIDELIESLRATGISSSNISAMLEKVKTQTNDKPKEIGKIEVKINDSKENVSK